MAMTKLKASFRGDKFFLSNFYPCKIFYSGKEYKSVEHAYQAAKTFNETWKKQIWLANTPGDAKRMGRMAPSRDDWDEVKLKVMEELLRIKFKDSKLKKMLLDTRTEKLVEENYWKDNFWGTYKGRGQNWLGRLLMKIRDELYAGVTQ